MASVTMEKPSACLPAHDSFWYLGLRAALSGGSRGASPSTADEVRHVMSSAKELTRLLAGHQMPLSLMVQSVALSALGGDCPVSLQCSTNPVD